MAVPSPQSYSYSESDSASGTYETVPTEQLEYILEYVTQYPSLGLPEQPLHDLISLVCDEPSAPEHVPPYLLAAACRTTFTPSDADAYFDEAQTALEHLAQLEAIRNRYVAEYQNRAAKSGNKFPSIAKQHGEMIRMVDYALTGLRRWSFVHEIENSPFNYLNCLASMNLIFPANLGDAQNKERPWATTVLRKVKQCMGSGSALRTCIPLTGYKESIPYTKAHSAMNRYLELAVSMIAKMEGILDPLPKGTRAMGMRREDCVMHRISRHLIAAEYNPEVEQATQTTALTETQSISSTQHSWRSIKDISPEL